MATKKPNAPTPRAILTTDKIKKGITRLERLIETIEAFDVSKLTKRYSPEQTALEADITGTLVSIFGHDTVEYQRYSSATILDHGGLVISLSGYAQDDGATARRYVTDGKESAIGLLKAAVNWLRDELADASEFETSASPATDVALSQKIFIVHGHDEGARESVARFIDKIGFDAVILSEQANQGRSIIGKIEAHSDVGFAVVLLTPDDVGGKTSDSLQPRARQNVLLELGYFMARLGRSRVFTLKATSNYPFSGSRRLK